MIRQSVDNFEAQTCYSSENDSSDDKIQMGPGAETPLDYSDDKFEQQMTPVQEETNETSAETPDNRGSTTLQDIDDEMWKKLKEIHELIADGGLKNSEKMLKKCFDLETGKTKIGKENNDKRFSLPNPENKLNSPAGQVTVKKRARSNVGLNANQNATFCTAALARSTETFYKNAVEKRNSSSSEDGVDLSDDSLDVPLIADVTTVAKCDQYNQNDNLGSHIQPSTSQAPPPAPVLSPTEKAEQLIREAE